VPIVAAAVVLGCVGLTLLILRGRQDRAARHERERERPPEVDEALERMRAWVRRPAVVLAGAGVVALVLVFALARNPGRWALLLLALAVLAVAAAAYVVRDRRRERR
jgi:Na+/H+ antiporter NhaD/arsenite permease-like protein